MMQARSSVPLVNLDLGELSGDVQRRHELRDGLYTTFPRLRERKGQKAGTMSGGVTSGLAGW